MLNKHILTIQKYKKRYSKYTFDSMIKTLLLGA